MREILLERLGRSRRGRALAVAIGAAATLAAGCGAVGDVESTGSSAAALRQRTAARSVVTTGLRHSCVVAADGDVFCWGQNTLGQVGDGTTDQRVWPVLVSLPTRTTQVVAGNNHTCALDGGGRVRCWGWNSEGQLGNGVTGGQSTTPVLVSGLTEVVQLAAGATHTCALRDDGTMLCWGGGDEGQLGHGSWSGSSVPVAVASSTAAIAIAAGGNNTCRVLASGTVSCWGAAYVNGSTTNYMFPRVVYGVSDAVAVDIGTNHACAVHGAGQVSCWGYNDQGERGDSGTAPTSVAAVVAGVSNVLSVSTGSNHTCAVLANGTARCWGNDYNGQLGDAGSGGPTPSEVYQFTGATQIAAGGFHTCAATINGRISCWGLGSSGQLGNGTLSNYPLPLQLRGLMGVLARPRIAAGAGHACAIDSSGAVRCWGENASGQLGTGTAGGTSPTPVAIPSERFTDIAAGDTHTCGLQSGTVKCWGANSQGQLGDGTTTARPSPTPVVGLTNVAAITAGARHTCALLASGAVRCWGANGGGELGNGSSAPGSYSSVPVVTGGATALQNVVTIAAGGGHTCALLDTGEARCWGRNSDSELGDGTATPRAAPVAVSGLTDAVAIASGARHTCAVTAAGAVRCWGANGRGQLGTGDFSPRSTPAAVVGVGDEAVAISASDHTCVTTARGRVRCWGAGTSGQLGDQGFSADTSAPRSVGWDALDLGGVTAIAAGSFHTCAMIDNGSARCWGRNTSGQLGTGDYVSTDAPVVVSSFP